MTETIYYKFVLSLSVKTFLVVFQINNLENIIWTKPLNGRLNLNLDHFLNFEPGMQFWKIRHFEFNSIQFNAKPHFL